ncbi:MAG: nicotinate phosphoribosyltransferase [Planctomycetota bacterium]
MTDLNTVYRTPLSLLTDLYQLTMAYGYWKLGRADDEAVFHLFFREVPFGGGYAIAAGLAHAVDFIRGFGFAPSDLDYLATLSGNDGKTLFETAFLDELGELTLTCDIDAVPEGTVVFPNEPMVRVRGSILQGQLLETALLNLINFQTLVATKAARVCVAAGDDAVLEFGLRRAQGIDGALAASRAAYIGGCAATSNVLAGKLFSIPVKGTHAHSWVMSFDDEPSAFDAYAQAMPNNCVFLVDTYDTLPGVRHAIEAGRRLRSRGYAMAGIRLDSGDLASLSVEARRLLDEAGFPDAVIVASNDLDEHSIQELKQRGATIATWGVGTKLATAYDQPALGGVYKLGAIRRGGGEWTHRVKLSEQTIKTSVPGMLQVRRFEDAQGYVADMIYDELLGAPESSTIIDPADATRPVAIRHGCQARDLLTPITRGGSVCFQDESLQAIRQRVRDGLKKMDPSTKRLLQPQVYPVGLEPGLHSIRGRLIAEARREAKQNAQD